jgi:hypothetical protein
VSETTTRILRASRFIAREHAAPHIRTLSLSLSLSVPTLARARLGPTQLLATGSRANPANPHIRSRPCLSTCAKGAHKPKYEHRCGEGHRVRRDPGAARVGTQLARASGAGPEARGRPARHPSDSSDCEPREGRGRAPGGVLSCIRRRCEVPCAREASSSTAFAAGHARVATATSRDDVLFFGR